MTHCKLLLFFITTTLLSAPSYAEEIDISRVGRCDDLFCPSGGGRSGASHNLEDRVGVVVRPVSAPNFPRLERTKIVITQEEERILRRGELNVRSGGGRGPGQTAPQRTAAEEAAGTDGITEDPAVKSSSAQGAGQAATSTNFGGHGQYTAPNGSKTAQQLKAGGFLYRDDEEDSPQSKPKPPNKAGTSSAFSDLPMDPVALNKKAGSNSPTNNSTTTFNPASTNSNGGFGSFESHGASANTKSKGVVGKIKDGLAEIANSLGEKFFGATGGRGKGNRRNLATRSAQNSKSKLNQKNGKTLNTRDLLKRGLSRYNSRNLANKLEFGSSRSFLFGNMCRHYVDYARAHSIPNDKSPCPKR